MLADRAAEALHRLALCATVLLAGVRLPVLLSEPLACEGLGSNFGLQRLQHHLFLLPTAQVPTQPRRYVRTHLPRVLQGQQHG